MSITNGYVTLAELRAVIYQGDVTSTASDGRLEQIIEAASRAIDNYCNRRFFGAAETRYYTADDGYELQIDDLTSLTALKADEDGDGTYETTWDTADYHLWPYNAALDGKPYTMIEVAESGDETFPTSIRKGVLVQGTFGYVASTNAASGCPDPIHDACLMAANRFYKRHDTPLGVAGNPQLGQQTVSIPRVTLDPDIKDLLDPYRRLI